MKYWCDIPGNAHQILMHIISLILAAVSMASIAMATPPHAPPPQAIKAESTCYVDLQDTSSVRASSLINGETFMLEIKMRKPDSDQSRFHRGNVIHSVAILKGPDSHFLPKALIREGFQTTCLFSLGKDRIGFVMHTGGGEKSSLFLYRIDTTNWHVVMEKWTYPTWIYVEATKGILDKKM